MSTPGAIVKGEDGETGSSDGAAQDKLGVPRSPVCAF